MSAPIFADPIMDGAADPTVINRRGTDEWWMFYTNRRATFEGPGVEWVHGSPIGVAVSSDGGLSWHYRGTVAGLDDPADAGLNTHWAPEVIWAEDEYHMFLSYISGTPDRWPGFERHIVHFTSNDLMQWKRIGPIALNSDFVIDAAVSKCPDGLYRLWYKDEGNGSSTGVATSRDLYHWTNAGVAIPATPGHEGPNVFVLGGWYWMIVDEWRGLGVFRSSDAVAWTRQGLILDRPGADPMDRQIGRHADVVPQGDHAAIFYFTHPQWSAAHTAEARGFSDRRTVIHWANLTVEGGQLICRRDDSPGPLDANHLDPAEAASDPAPLAAAATGHHAGTKAMLKPRVHAAVIEAIVQGILSGKYPEGQPLPPEAALCATLGVSHTALREALRVLVGKGLVKARPRIGTLVQPRSAWRMFDDQLMAWLTNADRSGAFTADIGAVRRSIEPLSAGLAADAASAHDLAALEEALARMRAAAAMDDIEAYVAADRDFHAGLLHAGHNSLLAQMSAVVTATADLCTRGNALRGVRPRAAIKLHEDLLESIRIRDAAGALKLATDVLADGTAPPAVPALRSLRQE